MEVDNEGDEIEDSDKIIIIDPNSEVSNCFAKFQKFFVKELIAFDII